MHKVLLVDDEPLIREGLRTIIDWEALGFAVAGDAANAAEALLNHGELSPGLMVVDIKMPGMNGLQLIEEVRKKDTACRFIILSGYGEFEYAKQAIGHGVSAYTLKPVNERELAALVGRVKEELEGREAAERVERQARAGRRKELLADLVAGSITESALAELSGGAERRYQLLMIKLAPDDRGVDLHVAERRLGELVEAQLLGEVFAAGDLVGVLVAGGWIRDDCAHPWDRILTQALGPERKFHAVAGKAVRRLDEIGESGMTVLETLDRSFILPPNRIQPALERHDRPASEPNVDDLARKLYYVLDIGNEALASDLLAKTGTLISQSLGTEQAIKTCFSKLLTILMNLVSANQVPVDVDRYFAMVTRMFKQTDYEGLYRTVESILGMLQEAIGRAGQGILVKRIIDFIDRHYRDNLKLELLAEVFNYSPGYLGRLIKHHLGESFHAYMDKVRIERAIELLKEGCKVHQAAEMVGYSDVDYFHRKFKKYKGMPPSSFKSLG